MCTGVSYKTKDFYFGRNLDNEFGFGEKVVVVPRNFPITFRHLDTIESHYALIGMGIVVHDYPLYFDAMNEKGLAIAGLNFVGNAQYQPIDETKKNVAQFELINYLLCTCTTVDDVRKAFTEINIDDESFGGNLPAASLHWLIADKNACIVVEAMKDGIHIHENPTGVLTNNPPFDIQLFLLNNYMHLTRFTPTNTFSDALDLKTHSKGMGAIGLPGDLSSTSRFVKCTFTKLNSVCDADETHSVSQFFHILHSVEQQKGVSEVKEGEYEYTLYSSCMNVDKGIYYYTTYDNATIHGVDMYRCDLDGITIETFVLKQDDNLHIDN